MKLVDGMLRTCAPILVIALSACALLGPPAAGARSHRDDPSARELWKDYPLEQEESGGERSDSAPRQTPTRAPASETDASATAAAAQPGPARDDGDGSPVTILGSAAAVILTVTALIAIRRRSGAGADTTVRAESPAPVAPARPSDAEVGRVAQIEWRHDADGSRFHVVARSSHGQDETIIEESESLEWPPTSHEAVLALTRAADELAASMTAAGWRAIEPGEAWYAKRFAREPAGRPSTPRSDRPAPGRFSRDSAPRAAVSGEVERDAGSGGGAAMTGAGRDGGGNEREG